MSWIERERKRMSAYGTTDKDQYLNAMIRSMEDAFYNASDIETVLHESATPNEFVEIDARVVARYKDSNVVTDFARKLIFRDPYYVVNVGDYFKFEGKTWLVSSTRTNTIPKSCIVNWCNNTIKFVDDNGNLHEIPCHIKNNLYELERDNFVRTPDNRIKVEIKSSPEMLKIIKFSPKWTRMLFHGQAYRVEAIDSVSNVNEQGYGTMFLLLKSDLISPYDDVENNIADRFKPRNISVQINNGYRIELQVGDTVQLDVTVMKDNEIIYDPILEYTSSDEDLVIIDENGLITALQDGSATITVSYNGVISNIIIEVDSVIDNAYSIVIEGNDSVFVGQERRYVGKVLNNGVEVFDKNIIWILTNMDDSMTDLATISPNGNEVVVKANNNYNVGKVKLKAVLSDFANVFSVKQITIKGLI
ncbi:MAG: hypothetical protein GX053_15420 [Tissierella sp.]|nr:hypothetical protein [Tissierella sp.]